VKAEKIEYRIVCGGESEKAEDAKDLAEILRLLRKMEDRIDKALRSHKEDHPEIVFDTRVLEKHILENHVGRILGEDPLATVIAHALATGDYLI